MKRVISLLLGAIMVLSAMSSMSVTSFAKTISTNDLKRVDYVCTKSVTEYSDGRAESNAYTYDSIGNLTKKVYVNKNSAGLSWSNTTTNTYDRLGNITQNVHANKDYLGSWNKVTYKYFNDSNGNLTKKTYQYKDKDGILQSENTVNSYNSKGYLTKTVHTISYHDGSSRNETTSNTYDSKGNLTKKVWVDKETGGYWETQVSVNTYDSNGNLTKISCSNKSSTDVSSKITTVNAYDSKGNLTKNTYMRKDSDGYSLTMITANTYDSNGNLTKKVDTSKDSMGTSYKRTTTYDGKGNMTKYDYSEQSANRSSSATTIVYTYDSAGKLKKKVNGNKSSNGSSWTRTTVYTYDSNGNLTKEVLTYNSSFDSSWTAITVNTYEKSKCEFFEDDEVQFKYLNAYSYSGKAKKPAVRIINNFDNSPSAMSQGVNYKLTYSNNINIGVGKITVHFIGSFLGRDDVVLPFYINPQAPTSFKASQTTSAVKLTWSNVAGATSYRIYKYNPETKKFEKCKNTTATSLTVPSLKEGSTYYFIARACKTLNGKNYWSKNSTVCKTTTLPSSVTSLKANSVDKTSVSLSWSKVTGATGYAVYQYNDGKWARVATVNTNAVTIKSLKLATNQYFLVRAFKTCVGKNYYGGYSSMLTVKTK